jgi:2-methylfumaryl-CoA hydratase
MWSNDVMLGGKSSPGNFFEDFELGMHMRHPTPRTVRDGDLSLYIALTGDRRPLSSSADVAHALGFPAELVPELLVFHIVFGKTVGQISLNAVANLGYADVRFLRPVYLGDTLRAESEVIGLREAANGRSGIVYVTSRGLDQGGREVVRYSRWVLVEKRDPSRSTDVSDVPTLPAEVAAADLPVPEKLDLARWPEVAWATGGSALWEDYAVGERIVHGSGMTIDEPDHASATRLYQNTAKVHFDQYRMARSRLGKRLVYGGHVISVAQSLAYDGLENLLYMAAWNSGTHANPTVAGDTLYAYSEVLDRAELPGRPDLGALRLRLVAIKNVDPLEEEVPLLITDDDGQESYHPRVVLDLDYWGLMPRRW